jgi:hypothetical protein
MGAIPALVPTYLCNVGTDGDPAVTTAAHLHNL